MGLPAVDKLLPGGYNWFHCDKDLLSPRHGPDGRVVGLLPSRRPNPRAVRSIVRQKPPLRQHETLNVVVQLAFRNFRKGDKMSGETKRKGKEVLTRLGIIGELLRALWRRKLWWIIPMIVVLVLFALVLVFAQGSAVAPFIYTLF